ncbi:MAG TPA: winged helix DNA-binding domain-containing protein [Candidatus Dormibacteraeota bacterium]|nr:winged helix DNA-binding domain-containing protein [Candidatus Dormibacteraeota bacterium]
MSGKSPAAAELTWPQVHAFRLARHHLTRRAPKKDLARVVGDIGGVQAQVMSAAELQVGVRVDCRVEDVRDALWKRKTLVKTWLMRATLHLVPSKDLPLYSAAMSAYGMRNTNAWLKWMQITEPEYVELIDAIGRALDGQPLSREELIAKVGKGRPERIQLAMKSGWGGVLKPVARKGLLCFGPSRGQSVTFVRPEQWLGSWRDMDPDAALIEVARRYLLAYGPATKSDFTRWWGTWPGVGDTAWAGLSSELVPVSIEGRRADMLSGELRHLTGLENSPSVHMLPAFDPYVMGHASRDHLFEAEHRSRVSRIAGWISPVVVIGGRVVGTWSYTVAKRALRVSVDPFRRLPPKALPPIRARARELADTLGLVDFDVKVV